MKRFLPILSVVPLVLGTIGYVSSGEMFTNALYAAFALYFTNRISDAYNLFIEIARWTAPLVMATAVLAILQSVWEALRNRVRLLWKKDTVSVYSDSTDKIIFDKNVGVIYPGEKYKRYAKEHIIMFSTDQKNLQFYEDHKKDLAGKKTYIAVKDMECSFFNPVGDVTVFDINSAIARMLWKEISLWNKGRNKIDIVVWGSGSLASDIISSGLQLNLFSLNQNINYHIISKGKLFSARHSSLELMNNDKLFYYNYDDPKNWDSIWDVISKANIVIVSEVPDIETMQTIVVKAGSAVVYYYSPKEGDVTSYFSYKNVVVPFGRDIKVLTDDNIRRGKLIKKAIALNNHYAELYDGEKNWNKLSGFYKGSNISSADFGEVLASISDRISEDEQAQLEHIRWCRYLFLNYYTYGTPTNGKNKDDFIRIHKDLVNYDELDPGEKGKDLEAIRITRQL